MIALTPTTIKNRLYILYKENKTTYERIIYSIKPFRHPTIQKDGILPIHTLDELLNNTSITTPFIQQLLPIETLFWQEASMEMKRAALFSYDYHHRMGNKKIPNVEIGNWMNMPFFARYLEATIKNAKPTNILHPRTMLNAIIALVGRHDFSVRMGHFHLTFDHVQEKPVYGIHWDFGLASASFSIVRHWLYDDLPA